MPDVIAMRDNDRVRFFALAKHIWPLGAAGGDLTHCQTVSTRFKYQAIRNC
jgi:hypothetical protein